MIETTQSIQETIQSSQKVNTPTTQAIQASQTTQPAEAIATCIYCRREFYCSFMLACMSMLLVIL